jgi:uncharacterized damage-inducible protein DinB
MREPIGRPAEDEYFADYYARYVNRVRGDDILDAMDGQLGEVMELFGALSESQSRYRYAEGKWSVREMLGHLVDAERVFGYRALCISRGEAAPLPSFDENIYSRNSGDDETPLGQLAEEFELLRAANLMLFERMSPAQWARRGTASGREVTSRALAWIIVGHVEHHKAVLQERYLPRLPA